MIPIYIGGLRAPEGIVSYRVKKSDIDSENSGRIAESGYATREVIRKGVAGIDIEWKNITSEVLMDIIRRISPDFFNVKYFDGEWKETRMYAGDRETEMRVVGDEQYWSLSVSFVEE